MRSVAILSLTVGFLATLWFVYAVTSRRRDRARESVLRQADQITALRVLVHDIQRVAREASDVDPSAALIITMIHDYEAQELKELR